MLHAVSPSTGAGLWNYSSSTFSINPRVTPLYSQGLLLVTSTWDNNTVHMLTVNATSGHLTSTIFLSTTGPVSVNGPLYTFFLTFHTRLFILLKRMFLFPLLYVNFFCLVVAHFSDGRATEYE